MATTVVSTLIYRVRQCIGYLQIGMQLQGSLWQITCMVGDVVLDEKGAQGQGVSVREHQGHIRDMGV
jgi:hypothetical protein